tara:strand:+ start:739 stop:1116 length:378 start_codon:yes stop_codon:yes gene_type:complete
MKDNSSRNILAIVVVIVMGGLIYISNQDTPLVEEYTPITDIIGADEPIVEDLPVITEVAQEPKPESLASKDNGIDLGEETILPEIAGYDNVATDDLPSLTLDGSHLIDVDPVELITVDDMPSLES